ncbi:MAG TPA: MarR family transcriptional regulator [Acidobacteriota bacterium]
MSQLDTADRHLAADLSSALRSLLRRCLSLDRSGCCGLPLSPVQCQVLEALVPGPLSMRELSRQLSVTPSTATRLVDPLVRRHWVERKASPEDRRVQLLRLRPEGRALRDQIHHVTMSWVETLLHSVPKSRRQGVVEALQLLEQSSAGLDCCAPGCKPASC